jgi:hypothetical protein
MMKHDRITNSDVRGQRTNTTRHECVYLQSVLRFVIFVVVVVNILKKLRTQTNQRTKKKKINFRAPYAFGEFVDQRHKRKTVAKAVGVVRNADAIIIALYTDHRID